MRHNKFFSNVAAVSELLKNDSRSCIRLGPADSWGPSENHPSSLQWMNKDFQLIFCLCLTIFWVTFFDWRLNFSPLWIGIVWMHYIAKHAVFSCSFLFGLVALLQNNTIKYSCLLWSLVKRCCGRWYFLKPHSIALLRQTLKPFVWDQCLFYIRWKQLSWWPILHPTPVVHFRWALIVERKTRKRWMRGRFHLLCLHLISLTAPLIFSSDWSV